MTRIILVRHGRSEANLAHCFAGHTDTPLSALGHAQARAVADYLFKNEQIDAIYTSDLSRAHDTALPTAQKFGLTIKTQKELREIFAGKWEGLPFDELDRLYGEDRTRWRTDLPHASCTGGETVREVFDRTVSAILQIAAENEGKTVLIASHWTPVLAAVTYASGGTVEDMARFAPVYNAALHTLCFENGRLFAQRINFTAHLDGIGTGAEHV